MGECGCSNNQLEMAKLDLPDGGIMVISVYPGCTDCARLAGIDIVKYANKEDYDVFVDDSNIKDLKDIDEYGYSFPVLDWAEIGKAVCSGSVPIAEYNSFEDFWYDHEENLREACWNTLNNFNDRQK